MVHNPLQVSECLEGENPFFRTLNCQSQEDAWQDLYKWFKLPVSQTAKCLGTGSEWMEALQRNASKKRTFKIWSRSALMRNTWVLGSNFSHGCQVKTIDLDVWNTDSLHWLNQAVWMDFWFSTCLISWPISVQAAWQMKRSKSRKSGGI